MRELVTGPRTRLLLIRHGEAHSNVQGTWVAHEHCPGLTALGREQVLAVGRFLAAEPGLAVDAVLSSSTCRALESADVIASCLPGEITRRADCAFCELHPPGGDATMLRPETRERIKADAWFSPEHGESRLAYAVRVRRSLLATVREFPGSTAAVVTHAGYIRRASAFAGGAAFADAPRPANASVTRLVVIRLADAGLRWQVAQYAEEVAADVTTGRG